MSRNKSQDKAKILKKLHKTPIVEAACRQTGLPRATYYRWRQEDEAFAEACDEAIAHGRDTINDMAESQLISAIKEGKLSAITYWLKHHHPTYETRVRVDGRVKHETESLTPEQEAVVARALHLAGLLPDSGDNDGKEDADERQ